MTDDQFWRIVAGSSIIAAIGVFRPWIMKWMHKIGYRDWREKPPDKNPKPSDKTRS